MPFARLQRLELLDFTAFGHAHLDIAEGLNVFIGENGTGKTHLLRVAYAMFSAVADNLGEQGPARVPEILTEKLMGAFRPDKLAHLRRRGAGRRPATILARFSIGAGEIRLSFGPRSQRVKVDGRFPDWLGSRPVYLGTQELLALAPGFVALSDNYQLPFDGTWRDTCSQLELPPVRGERDKRARELLKPLETQMQGSVEFDAGRFYLRLASGRMEMHLVPEGVRKLATLARLIGNGRLLDPVALFWDEPETNLNPKTMKLVVNTLLSLCRAGGQVFVATQSLFLMREIDVQLRTGPEHAPKARFFGLRAGREGTEVKQNASVDRIGEITSLQEELSQSDRYLAADL